MTQGQAADASADFVADLMTKQSDEVTKEVFASIDATGTLEGPLAILSWLRLYEIMKLSRKLRNASEVGRRAAIKLAPDMDIGGSDAEG